MLVVGLGRRVCMTRPLILLRKRAYSRSNLRVRTLNPNGQSPSLDAAAKTRSQSQKPPHKDLEPKWLKPSLDAAAKTRSQSQQSPCKDLKPKWPKPSHLGLRPLTLRLLSAPVRALKKCTPRLLEGCGHGTTLCFTLP